MQIATVDGSPFTISNGEATTLSIGRIFRVLFIIFGVPDELSTNGSLKFTPNSFKTFLKIWGVQHQKSSVEYSQPNGRAKVAVKSAKCIIYSNTGTNGSPDNNKVAQAILQYHNTPLQDCNLSPAQILFHRELRDKIPNHPSHYKLHPEWLAVAQHHEEEYIKKHLVISTEYNWHTKELPAIPLGTLVLIQGKDKKCRKKGKVIDTLDHRQYYICLMDLDELPFEKDVSSKNAYILTKHLGYSRHLKTWQRKQTTKENNQTTNKNNKDKLKTTNLYCLIS